MIAVADLHLRKTKPLARTDNYWEAQERKFRFILEHAAASPPLVVAGDFFDVPRPGPFMEQWVITLLREYGVTPIVVPGQHDMPFHSLDRLNDSGLGVLAAADAIHLVINNMVDKTGYFSTMWGSAFGQVPPTLGQWYKNNILIWHHMVIPKGNPNWPGQEADTAQDILVKYPQFSLIITGDNHRTFTVGTGDYDRPGPKRLLVNPGSMMRMKTDQVTHKPCLFRLESDLEEQIFLPIEPNVLDLSHIDESKEKDARVHAFVERLRTDVEFGLEFEVNLREYLSRNQVEPEVEALIWECVGKGGGAK